MALPHSAVHTPSMYTADAHALHHEMPFDLPEVLLIAEVEDRLCLGLLS